MQERNTVNVSDVKRWRLTRVVKEGIYKGAVLEDGSDRGDIFKIAVEERRVNECDSFELHTDKPAKRRRQKEEDITVIKI